MSQIKITGKVSKSNIALICYMSARLRHLMSPRKRDKYNRKRAFNIIIEDIYGVHHLSNDLMEAETDEEILAVFEDAGMKDMFFLCDNEQIYQAVNQVIELYMDLQIIQDKLKNIRSMNRVPDKRLVKDSKEMEEGLKKALRKISEIAGRDKKSSSGILSKYGILDEIVGKKKKSKDGNFFEISSDPDEIFESIMEDYDEEDFEEPYQKNYTIDDYRNGVIPEDSGFLKFLERNNLKEKTQKIQKKKRSHYYPKYEKDNEIEELKDMISTLLDRQRYQQPMISHPIIQQPQPQAYGTKEDSTNQKILETLNMLTDRISKIENSKNASSENLPDITASKNLKFDEDDDWEPMYYNEDDEDYDDKDNRFEYQKLYESGIRDPNILRNSIKKEFGALLGNPNYNAEQISILKEMATNALLFVRDMDSSNEKPTVSTGTPMEEIMSIVDASDEEDDEEPEQDRPKISKVAQYNMEHGNIGI